MTVHPRRLPPLRDWSLRARLIASFLGLLIVLCAGIGFFTEVALSRSLTNQLDKQLVAAGGMSARDAGHQRFGPDSPRDDDPGRYLLPPGNPIGSIGAVIQGGTVEASALQDGSNTRPALSTAVQQRLLTLPADGRPHSVELPGLGDYRVLARTMPDGDVLISGFSLSEVSSTLADLTLAITALALLGVVIAGLVGTLIVRLALRPLQRVTATASRVAELPLDEGEVALAERVPDPNPHTEVGQVGVALNRMLENVNEALNARHRSETRVRQFVADASHELRTPLASIRGYAELTRRSRDAAPPDIAHAMSRVESEAGRMTALVDDLLLLARLDAGRPLESAEVDLTRLAVDATSDAHAAGPRHHWQLAVPVEPVVVLGDAPRLHQVVTNLLANARTHTPPGTTVRISLSRQANLAVLAVHDDGPGIPAELMPDIFERFSRGEQSRSRAAGSTGLGLAIVAAVVAAHHGRIVVHSSPGDTVFTVELPIHGISPVGSQTAASLAGNPV
ncbi:sensor histidine kinase [Jatrophihabitans sp.]|uniref:sensor histidine kinase n=1 Tax=Jatrophihabitans sp. TaxID=1932789 RepID=UPI002C8A9F91|nr:HAMP domain-containing sensor histidine kinase [Jatrophihabitans sp.]